MKGVKRAVSNLAAIGLMVCNVGCDQMSKRIVRENIQVGESIPLLTDHMILTKVENTGAFLSLGHAWPGFVKVPLLMILPIFVLTTMLIYLLKNRRLDKTTIAAFSFMIGGGAGNLIDRVAYGTVTDFLHINLWGVRTGVFNLADVSIMIGVFLLILSAKRKVHSPETM